MFYPFDTKLPVAYILDRCLCRRLYSPCDADLTKGQAQLTWQLSSAYQVSVERGTNSILKMPHGLHTLKRVPLVKRKQRTLYQKHGLGRTLGKHQNILRKREDTTGN